MTYESPVAREWGMINGSIWPLGSDGPFIAIGVVVGEHNALVIAYNKVLDELARFHSSRLETKNGL